MRSEFYFFARWTVHLLKWILLIPIAWLLYPVYPKEITRMKLRLLAENRQWEAESRVPPSRDGRS